MKRVSSILFAVVLVLGFTLVTATPVAAQTALSIVASVEGATVYTGHYQSWAPGDWAYLVTATVTSGGDPVSGVTVVADVIGPSGEEYWLRDGTQMLYDTVQGEGMDESGMVSGPIYGGGTNDGVYANFLELDPDYLYRDSRYFGSHAGTWTIRLTASKEGYDSASTELTVNVVQPTGNYGHSFKFIDLDASTPEEDWAVCASPGETLNARLVYDETNKCIGGCCIFYIRAWGCPYEEWGSNYDIDSGCTSYRSDVERTWTYTVPSTPGVYTMTLADIFAYFWPFYGDSADFVGKVVVAERQCVATATDTGTACFTTSNGAIENLAAVETPAGAPVEFPHGLFSFEVAGLSSGQDVTITIELPQAAPIGTKWWKYQSGSWYSLDIGDDDGDNIITVTLQDGVFPGDEDSTPEQITDDGGPGNPGAVGWETYSINKVRVLLPWIALAVILAGGMGWYILRHRMVQS